MGTVTAPWKQLLLNALESNSHIKHSSFFQLATIGSNGRPSNRTVVFRGFQENSDKFQINTDSRSHKIEELKHCPFAEQREKSWFASSVKSRLQYLGPIPGFPCISEHPNQEIALDPSTGPVGAFCLLVLDPDQVDYLNLKSNQRLKFISTLGLNGVKSWTSERINP
ncbi:PREDICTED: pyridoxine/pyridoxamine 5'-phosphate oxidase 2 isoform X2 [Theobroma cacao]|uniref:pyridoxal 5'-phosphate synthase n=2 Tax=Theobroma cacao TaxID=3641 RepID=A0AB32VLX2_THECC|nr:PREDICTED: pyridoxine/pyridoxamine 5'-phosphate oxidase 2 isoform X2 [Theobroma cacao]EOX95663.1 Pyridoxamine 5'-phosphate oxidase family protein isoform 2 [Theobroma cacao]